MPTILVIDDNHAVITALETLFSLHDIDTVGADSPEAGLAALRGGGVDLVSHDMDFRAETTSCGEGVALFGDVRRTHPGLAVLLLTARTYPVRAVTLYK